jgi:hypothetical protein
VRVQALTKDYLSKVLVGRQQQVCFLVCRGKDGVVRDSWLHLGNIPYKMTVLPKAFNDLTVNTLISQEIHATASAMG